MIKNFRKINKFMVLGTLLLFTIPVSNTMVLSAKDAVKKPQSLPKEDQANAEKLWKQLHDAVKDCAVTLDQGGKKLVKIENGSIQEFYYALVQAAASTMSQVPMKLQDADGKDVTSDTVFDTFAKHLDTELSKAIVLPPKYKEDSKEPMAKVLNDFNASFTDFAKYVSDAREALVADTDTKDAAGMQAFALIKPDTKVKDFIGDIKIYQQLYVKTVLATDQNKFITKIEGDETGATSKLKVVFAKLIAVINKTNELLKYETFKTLEEAADPKFKERFDDIEKDATLGPLEKTTAGANLIVKILEKVDTITQPMLNGNGTDDDKTKVGTKYAAIKAVKFKVKSTAFVGGTWEKMKNNPWKTAGIVVGSTGVAVGVPYGIYRFLRKDRLPEDDNRNIEAQPQSFESNEDMTAAAA